jgi:hypothetical protein
MEFWYKSASVSYKFTCSYSATLSTNSVIGFILSADASAGKFYLFDGTNELEITATRSTLSAPYTEVFSSTPTGHRVADHSSFVISDYVLLSRDIGKAGFSEYFENADRV